MRGKLTPEFVHLSEIVFAVSGLVGGFGDKYARNAAAHAMHDAMSKFYQKVMTIYMAKKVAYGIFYQLALEKKVGHHRRINPLLSRAKLAHVVTTNGPLPRRRSSTRCNGSIY